VTGQALCQSVRNDLWRINQNEIEWLIVSVIENDQAIDMFVGGS
jgi:hypothetical protein